MIARSTAVAVQPAAARLHHVVLTGKTGGPGTARGVGRTCEWSWLASASSVSIDLDDGTGTLTLAVAGPSGFIRWVDRNALAVDLPRGSALDQALSRPSRSP